MSGFARTVHIVLLGIWVGASLFFLALAPQIGSIVESRHLAGDVILAALSILDAYGVLAGPVILFTLFIGWLPLAVPLRTRTLGAVLMIGAVLLSRYWTTPAIVEAKRGMSHRLEYADPSHPLMQQLDSFHTISSALMLLHLIAALLMLIAAERTSRPRRSFGGIEL